MGIAYMGALADRTLLLVQLQAWRLLGSGRPGCRSSRVQFAASLRRGGLRGRRRRDPPLLRRGMLLNVGAAVQVAGKPITWTLDHLGGAD
jgi:hypothetical protein